MSVRVLVFGARGQMARALAAAETPMTLAFAGRDRLDLARVAAPALADVIAAAAPAAVINAAAYTAVDRAEHEADLCARLNREAPSAIGEICARRDIPLVHVSTDYVFDGEKGAPYVEADARAPLNVYGRTKAQGEDALAALTASGARIAIMRPAWVFAPGGGGFFGAMLRAAAETDEVAVVADQWGSPTPASACADAALVLATALLDRDPAAAGLFHAAGADGVSRAAFAEAVFALTPRRPRVRCIAAAEHPTPARRPRDTRLSSARLEGAFGWRAPSLAEALAACLASPKAGA
jgi:dTDP-4-dehydrorhamnose reductase